MTESPCCCDVCRALVELAASADRNLRRRIADRRERRIMRVVDGNGERRVA